MGTQKDTLIQSTSPMCETMGIEEEDADRESLGRRLVEELPAAKLQEFAEIFSFFDRDGGGSIGTDELEQVMRTFGWSPTEEELKDLGNVIDQQQDGNGDISFNEFVWLMTREFKDSDIEGDIREAFRVFDKEGNGFISTQDLMEVMQTIGEILSVEEAQEMIEEADMDGDGNVNYEEFVAMIFKGDFGASPTSQISSQILL